MTIFQTIEIDLECIDFEIVSNADPAHDEKDYPHVNHVWSCLRDQDGIPRLVDLLEIIDRDSITKKLAAIITEVHHAC